MDKKTTLQTKSFLLIKEDCSGTECLQQHQSALKKKHSYEKQSRNTRPTLIPSTQFLNFFSCILFVKLFISCCVFY
jgi:hypothetical protein